MDYLIDPPAPFAPIATWLAHRADLMDALDIDPENATLKDAIERADQAIAMLQSGEFDGQD